jgi:hypothetical protein
MNKDKQYNLIQLNMELQSQLNGALKFLEERNKRVEVLLALVAKLEDQLSLNEIMMYRIRGVLMDEQRDNSEIMSQVKEIMKNSSLF